MLRAPVIKAVFERQMKSFRQSPPTSKDIAQPLGNEFSLDFELLF